jgi:hypothetical protein
MAEGRKNHVCRSSARHSHGRPSRSQLIYERGVVFDAEHQHIVARLDAKFFDAALRTGGAR